MSDPRAPSHRLTFEDAVEVWLRWHRGDFHNRIAADFDVNPARIYEVIYEELYPGSKAIAENTLGLQITRRPRRRNEVPKHHDEPTLF